LRERTVLKESEIYLVSDENGDISAQNAEGHGLYWRDTRYLSRYELELEGTRPVLLSTAGEFNFMNNLQFANEALESLDGQPVPARSISIRRNRFIHDGLHERIGFFNYNRFPVRIRAKIAVGSDFRDMFDVRGYTNRSTHGTIEAPLVDGGRIELRYVGLDGVRRGTEIVFDPVPRDVQLADLDLVDRITARVLPGVSGHGDPRTEYAVTPPTATVEFELVLPTKEPRSLTVHVAPTMEAQRPDPAAELPLDSKFLLIRDSYQAWDEESTEFVTDHELLNQVIRRASRDLRLLSDVSEDGYLPSAGIPWFSVPFGRDSLITSIQTLALQPRIAHGSLRFLAEHQGKQIDDWRDEEPGKILHEVRMGEVARLGQVPHAAYYGSVDSTPLFLVALGELLNWTDDLEFARALLPNVEAALRWLDEYGDRDGDGYVEYKSRSTSGIRNQGWKDSIDAVAYPDGRLVEPPIALAEVQGYVYAARLQAAAVFRRLDQEEQARALEARAAELRRRFEKDFWLEAEGYYALALGPDKRPVEVVSSNPGHCTWTGLLAGRSGRAAAQRLLQEDMDSGWGIRTLSNRAPMFNPMSYHNGSIWPHDNALLAAGFKRLGLDGAAARIVGEVLEAAMRFPQYRLPELYCGFGRDRRYFSMPAQYPVSCSPQAWAAGSVFQMIQTLLGLRAEAAERRIHLRPLLPEWLNRISIRRLRIADTKVDFEVSREQGRTRVEIWDSGGLEIAVEPAAEQTRASRRRAAVLIDRGGRRNSQAHPGPER
jgi:glycogen debranching enzyme